MKKGFSLIELLIYVSIFAVAGGMMFGILALILKVNQRESSSGEITSQLNFVSQTLSRLIRSSSNIEIDAGVATSTLKLRMKDPAKDPTCIYLDDVNKIIKLAEGPDAPLNSQNCTPNASELTSNSVKVDKLEFTKSTQYPGHNSINMNIQMSYNSQNQGAQASREIKSASMRFSTAEFDGDILPSNDALYNIGSSTNRWRNAALSGNLLVAGNIGIGTTTPSERLTVVNGNISQELKSNPIIISQISGAVNYLDSAYGVYVSGKYAYVTSADSDALVIIDISNPALPVRIGQISEAVNYLDFAAGVYVSGKYAYVASAGSDALVIIDISGMETVSANIHSLEAGNLQVRNDIIAQGQLQISGGINVGSGGIFSAGPIGVSIASTTQTDAISAYFQGRVGIATTTPSQALEVNGGIRLNPISESQPACNVATDAGVLWHVQGVNDELQICAASSSIYEWRSL